MGIYTIILGDPERCHNVYFTLLSRFNSLTMFIKRVLKVINDVRLGIELESQTVHNWWEKSVFVADLEVVGEPVSLADRKLLTMQNFLGGSITFIFQQLITFFEKSY